PLFQEVHLHVVVTVGPRHVVVHPVHAGDRDLAATGHQLTRHVLHRRSRLEVLCPGSSRARGARTREDRPGAQPSRPIMPGIPSERAGTEVISSRSATSPAKYGNRRGTTCSMDTPDTPEASSSAEPTDGRRVPMHIARNTTMPKCTVSSRRSAAIGRKIGVKIRIAGVMSRKVPTTRRIATIIARISTALSVAEISAEVSAPGMPEYAITQAIAEDAAIRSITTPAAETVRIAICLSAATSSDR